MDRGDRVVRLFSGGGFDAVRLTVGNGIPQPFTGAAPAARRGNWFSLLAD
jgi:hypothetical protein